MARFLYLFFLLATYTITTIADGSSPSQSPSPTLSPTNCTDVVMGMIDCLTYIEKGSKESKPSSNCCNELKTVVNKSPDCLCEGIKMASNFGIKLNMKRATGLPHACGLPSSDFGGCNSTSVPSPSSVVPSPPPPPPVTTPPPISPPVPPPPSISPPVPPPPSAPTPPPPVLPQTPPQHSPAPPISPPTLAPKAPVVEPPAQSSQPSSLAPSPSSSCKLSCSMLALCVGVAITSFSYLDT